MARKPKHLTQDDEDLLAQFIAGTSHEMEHTDKWYEASRTAVDHLREDRRYYSVLKRAFPEEGARDAEAVQLVGRGLRLNPSFEWPWKKRAKHEEQLARSIRFIRDFESVHEVENNRRGERYNARRAGTLESTPRWSVVVDGNPLCRSLEYELWLESGERFKGAVCDYASEKEALGVAARLRALLPKHTFLVVRGHCPGPLTGQEDTEEARLEAEAAYEAMPKYTLVVDGEPFCRSSTYQLDVESGGKVSRIRGLTCTYGGPNAVADIGDAISQLRLALPSHQITYAEGGCTAHTDEDEYGHDEDEYGDEPRENPLASFHTARQEDPSEFVRYGSQYVYHGEQPILMVYGVPADGGGSRVQSIRFPAGDWTEAAACRWLLNHGYTTSFFEPAVGE